MFVPECCSFYILAGGQSSRFGSDKAIAEVDGRPLLLHVAEALRTVTSDITVVSNGTRGYEHLGVRTIHDETPDLGPVGGLLAAMRDSKQPWVFVAPCDVVGWRSEFLDPFIGVSELGAAFYTDRWEPLFAAYQTSIVDRVAEAAREKGSMWRLLESVGAKRLNAPLGWEDIERWNSVVVE